MSIFRSLWPWLAAILSGLLLVYCFAPFDQTWLVWLWMAPLLSALWYSGKRGKWHRLRCFGLGYVTGAVFFLGNLKWIGKNVMPGIEYTWFLLPLYLGLYIALWAVFAGTVGRPKPDVIFRPGSKDESRWKWAFAPSAHTLWVSFINAAAWTGIEWLRGIILTGFGWNGLGVALHDQSTLIQICDIIGATGLSFLPAFCGVMVVLTLHRFYLEITNHKMRPHLDFGIAVSLIVVVFFYGVDRINSVLPEEPQSVMMKRGSSTDMEFLTVQGGLENQYLLSVGIAQEHISQEIKMDWSKSKRQFIGHRDAIHQIANDWQVDLIILPESAFPTRLIQMDDPDAQYFKDFIQSLLAYGDFDLVFGVDEYVPETDSYHNTIAHFYGDTQSAQVYRKVHLVPFGEYLPFRNSFPLFQWLAGGLIEGDFTAGQSTEPLPLKKSDHIELIPLICFEDTVPRLARKFVREGHAQVIVNATNDGWFQKSEASVQHVRNAKFRCVELRRPMVRAANTGVSCYIDPLGNILAQVEDPKTGNTFVDDTLTLTIGVPKEGEMTFYARNGEVFSVTMLVIAGLTAGWGFWRGRRQRLYEKKPKTSA